MHGRQTGPIPQVRQDHASLGHFRSGHPREFFHQISIRQAVETIALHSFGVEAPGNRKQLGDSRHGLMKCRVETGQLGQFGMPLAERLNQFDLAGQMIRVVRPDAMQLIQQILGDDLGLGVFHPMDNPGVPAPRPKQIHPASRASQSRHSRPTGDRRQ